MGSARPLWALLAGATCIGFAPIFVRWSEVGPSATAFYRLALAVPFLSLWSYRTETAQFSWRRDWHLMLSGLFFAADLAVWHQSIELTTVANATLLANFAPIFVVFGSWLLWRKPIRLQFLAALAVVLGGVSLLAQASFATNPTQLLGDALGLLTAVFYGAYILSVAQLRTTYSTPWVSLGSSLFGAIALSLVTGVSGEVWWPSSVAGWGALVGLALVSQVGGQSLITYALAHLPTTFSSVGLMFQPAIATLLAWGLLGENLSLIQVLGAVLVLIGITWARVTSQESNNQDST